MPAGIGIFVFLIILVGISVYIIIKNKNNIKQRGSYRKNYYRCHFYKPFKTGEQLGDEGENIVCSLIGDTIPNQQYVINNLILNNKGKSSQIDHIVINPRGVFVIETKNYSGAIYGYENQQYWTQYIGDEQNDIYNPLKQNATHVYNVKKIIGDLPIRSLVVFVQNNVENINATNVIPVCNLRTELELGEGVLTDTQMKTAYIALMSNRSSLTTEEHVENIKKQQQDLADGICPRCGGKLVLRNGKYGSFWGCSNYPKCKFIKKD